MPGAMGLPEFFLPVWRLEKIKEHQETEEDIKRASRSLFYGKEDGRICICHGLGRAYSDYEEISGTT